MRTTRNRLISWMLVLVMALSLISPDISMEAKAAETYAGYTSVIWEKMWAIVLSNRSEYGTISSNCEFYIFWYCNRM